MTASALLRHGLGHAEVLLDGLEGVDAAQGLRFGRRGARAARRPPVADARRHTSAPATSPRWSGGAPPTGR